MIPRVYQEHVFNIAKEENVIAFLPTGIGKTLISVLLLQHYSQLFRKEEKNVVFLAPTVPLVEQQATYIQENAWDLSVAAFAGKGEYNWPTKDWKQEMRQYDVIVMTPMLFLNLLIAGFCSLSSVSLLIFDECHHCTKKHPYNIIFTDFYYDCKTSERPRIFGMTASPIASAVRSIPKEIGECDLCNVKFFSPMERTQHLNGSKHRKRLLRSDLAANHSEMNTSGSLSITRELTYDEMLTEEKNKNISESLLQLESRMDSRLVVPDEDCTEYRRYNNDPNEHNISYTMLSDTAIEEILLIIQVSLNSWTKVNVSISDLLNTPELLREEFDFPIADLFSKLIQLCKELGSIALVVFVDLLLNETKHSPKEHGFLNELHTRLLSLVEKLIEEMVLNKREGYDGGEQEFFHLCSPKMKLFLGIIAQYQDDNKGVFIQPSKDGQAISTQNDTPNERKSNRMIVFVRTRRTAKILQRILSHPQKYSLKENTDKECEQRDKLTSTNSLLFFLASQFDYSFHEVGILLGNTKKEKGRKLLNSFASGVCKTIIATSVAEEGIDICSCNCVVCFDCENISAKSYTQRKGRARHRDSHLFFFSSQRDLCKLQKQEKAIIAVAQNRNSYTPQQDEANSLLKGQKRYFECLTSPKGGKITEHTAKQVLNQYISLLPGDSYWKPSIYFKSWKTDNGFMAECFLPVNCSLKRLQFKSALSYPTRKEANASAAFASCKELFDNGILNDHFLPFAELEANELVEDLVQVRSQDEPEEISVSPVAIEWKPITNRCVRDTTEIKVFSTKVLIEGEEEFRAREISFLSHKQFPKRITLTKGTKLHIVIEPSTEVTLTARELQEHFRIHQTLQSFCSITTAKRFQFGSNGGHETEQDCLQMHGEGPCPHEAEQQLYLQYFPTVSLRTLQTPSSISHFSNANELARELEEKLIFIPGDPIQFLWYVRGVDETQSPDSIMTQNGESCITYRSHYETAYSIAPEQIEPSQPLITITRVCKTKNFEEKEKENYWRKKEQLQAIPQHCWVFPASVPQFQAIQILPTIMWQLNQHTLAESFIRQCSEELPSLCEGFEVWDDSLPRTLLSSAGCMFVDQLSSREVFSLLLQMAFTTPNASLKFNYELLETLGDSFLKYSTSDYLYTKHPNQHEGILTAMRTKIISNQNLYQLAAKKHLERYIVTNHCSPFKVNSKGKKIPLKWMADIVEALIGTFLLYGGRKSAKKFLQWIGIPCFSPNEMILPAPLKRECVEKPNDLHVLEQTLGYRFKDWNLLNIARTHASYEHGGQCYQRLEFLGDAVLDFLVTLYFFDKFKSDLSPHTLTALRSDTVSNDTFAKAVVERKLHKFIRHNCPAIKQHLSRFETHVNSMESESERKEFLLSLKYRTPKVVADVLEAFAGAVFLDAKKDTRYVWNVFFPMLRKENLTVQSLRHHPIVILHELQGKDVTIQRKLTVVESQNREKEFSVTYFANGEVLYSAVDKNKASSSTGAAIGALSLLFDVALRALAL